MTATKKDKAKQLEEIRADILKRKVCNELARSAKGLVLGEGNPDADVMFIGEAPGEKEDEQGRPFVGAAGKFLNEMLESIGLKRENVYITNIVKYRPPNNRDPLPEEKDAFMPYLVRQIDVIKPLLIATLGRHSMNMFLPDLRISQVHGQPKRFQGQVYLPLYHPAAALYNGAMRETLTTDFHKIPAIINKLK